MFLAQKYSFIIAFLLTSLPLAAAAQTASGFLGRVQSLLQLAVALLIAAAGIIFVWGVVKFIASGDDAAQRKKAGAFMLFGIIGIAVILAFWGLTRVVLDYFGFASPESRSSIPAPQIPTLPGARPSFPSSPIFPPRDVEF